MVGMLAALAAAALAATAGTEPPAAAAAAAAAAATQTRPSFVWILADDLEADWKQDRKEIMPNLKRALSEGGLEFVISRRCGCGLRPVPIVAALWALPTQHRGRSQRCAGAL